MEDLAQALERLAMAGYCEGFRAESGRLRAVGNGSLHEPQSLVIEEIVRFEGASDPEDQAVLFALRSEPQGIRGTFVAAYGLYMDALDGAMIRRFTDGRRRGFRSSSATRAPSTTGARPRRRTPPKTKGDHDVQR